MTDFPFKFILISVDWPIGSVQSRKTSVGTYVVFFNSSQLKLLSLVKVVTVLKMILV